MVAIPDSVVQMQLAANGAAGRAWLAELPRLIGELRELWSITEIGPAFEGGCVAYVAPVVHADGSRAVLKISLPDDETEREADALALWNGNGAVRLLESDPHRGALLLEPLEPGTPLAAHPDRDQAMVIACSLLRRLWIPAPAGHRFRLVTDLARYYAHTFPEKYRAVSRPFAESLVLAAIDLCREFARDPTAPVLANRDFHLDNVLAAQREPWLVIDPKPLAGEPAFDTGHFVRSLLRHQTPSAACARTVSAVADRLGLDPRRIAQWVFVRSIDNALWELETATGDGRWDVECALAARQSFHLL